MCSSLMTDTKIRRKYKIYKQNYAYGLIRCLDILFIIIDLYSQLKYNMHKIFTYIVIYLWDEMKISLQCLLKYLL